MENKTNTCCRCTDTQVLDRDFWQSHYDSGSMGWDLGEVSPPLRAFIDTIEDKDTRILIPGCGNAYEAIYLAEKGFTQVTIIDIAPAAAERARKIIGEKVKVIEGDFFLHDNKYDLILEQTFFCALHPSLRVAYRNKMYELLAPGGMLVGVLFDKEFDKEGPPFGGNRAEYDALFREKFEIKHLESCDNSAQPRKGTEVFIQFVKH